jgi:Tfp pilus assembly protein PilF
MIEGRAELEEVVANEPSFAWAWLDLAKISERIGELTGAVDEARAAAEAALAADHPQAGYFHAQLARLAARTGDEATRAVAAKRAAELAPALKAAQLEGARESLEDGDLVSARGLMDLLRAVWPRDLEVLDLARRIDGAEN